MITKSAARRRRASTKEARVFQFEGQRYKLKPSAKPEEFPQGGRFAQLVWLERFTYPRGHQKESIRIGGAKLA